jgi:hypothetical protein
LKSRYRTINGIERCQRRRELFVLSYEDDGYTPLVRYRREGLRGRHFQVCNRPRCYCECSVCGCELEHTDVLMVRVCGVCSFSGVRSGVELVSGEAK